MQWGFRITTLGGVVVRTLDLHHNCCMFMVPRKSGRQLTVESAEYCQTQAAIICQVDRCLSGQRHSIL